MIKLARPRIGVQVGSVGGRQRDGLGRRVSSMSRIAHSQTWYVLCLGAQVLWPHVAHVGSEVVPVKVDRRRKRNWGTCERAKAGAQSLAHLDGVAS
jgi:hypothetical protein